MLIISQILDSPPPVLYDKFAEWILEYNVKDGYTNNIFTVIYKTDMTDFMFISTRFSYLVSDGYGHMISTWIDILSIFVRVRIWQNKQKL